MNRKDRAKQFMAFDALKGLREELTKKELEHEEKREIAGAKLEELEENFNRLQIGNKTEIVYYKNHIYKKIVGILKGINKEKKNITIDNEIINICDIFNITII